MPASTLGRTARIQAGALRHVLRAIARQGLNLLAVGGCAALASASVRAATIDFEDLPVGTVVRNDYVARLGVRFEAARIVESPGGGKALEGWFDGPLREFHGHPITVHFDPLQASVSVKTGLGRNVPAVPVTHRAFDGCDQVVDSSRSSPIGPGPTTIDSPGQPTLQSASIPRPESASYEWEVVSGPARVESAHGDPTVDLRFLEPGDVLVHTDLSAPAKPGMPVPESPVAETELDRAPYVELAWRRHRPRRRKRSLSRRPLPFPTSRLGGSPTRRVSQDSGQSVLTGGRLAAISLSISSLPPMQCG